MLGGEGWRRVDMLFLPATINIVRLDYNILPRTRNVKNISYETPKYMGKVLVIKRMIIVLKVKEGLAQVDLLHCGDSLLCLSVWWEMVEL